MKRLVLSILLAVTASTTAPVEAQPRPPGPRVPVNRREQIKKRIRIMRANELTEELALDEATAGKLFPLLARYDDELDRLLEKKVQIARQLEAAAGQAAAATDRVIDDAIANQKALWSSEERRLGELRKILSAGQVAKLLIVLPALERKIQNQLRRAIENANAKGDDDVEPDERPRPRQLPPQRISPPGCDPLSSKDCH